MNFKMLGCALSIGISIFTSSVLAYRPASMSEQTEYAQQPRTQAQVVPEEQNPEKQAFLAANEQYIRDNPECSVYTRGVWFKYLDRHQLKALVRLYTVLRGEKTMTDSHARALNRSLFEFQNSFAYHSAFFSREFLDILKTMQPEDACQFFNTMCAIIPRSAFERSWFGTLEAFFDQLPQNERNLDSLHQLADLLHAEKDPFGRYRLFNAWGTVNRLIALDLALECGKVTMSDLREVLTTEPPYWDTLWHRKELYGTVSGCAAIAAATIIGVFVL